MVEDSWYKKRLHRPQFIIDNINSYKKEMDIVEKWIEDWCEISDEYDETSSKLFRSFNQYCKENKLFEMNSTLFGRNMGKKFQKIRRNNGINYLGIKLKGSI
jgi:putative DNA primase/helicase